MTADDELLRIIQGPSIEERWAEREGLWAEADWAIRNDVELVIEIAEQAAAIARGEKSMLPQAARHARRIWSARDRHEAER